MRIGQTSAIVFAAKLLTSALGFVATLYFARILGAEVLGYFALTLTVTKWLQLFGDVGVSSAVKKRMSEGADPDAYFIAGVFIVVLFGIAASIGIIVFREVLNSYIGVEVAEYIIILLIIGLIGSIISSGLEGKRLVHITGLLSPITTGGRSFTQIIFVVAGFELVGMLLGHALGSALTMLIGLSFLSVRFHWPSAKHFSSLFNYAKYSWLGNLRGRSFNDIDILVLGALVSPKLVGIYSVAWSLTSFVGTFGSSIRQTMFPELSYADAEKKDDLFKNLVADSIAYTGLIAIPGVFGAFLIGDRLLQIYGNEFTQGITVLGLLIVSMLIYDYQSQLQNALNAFNRPDISFKINLIFIFSNLIMNIILVIMFGWIGAAVATLLAAGIGLSLSFYYLRTFLMFDVPTGELGYQLVAALVMALVVGAVRFSIESMVSQIHNSAFVVGLVVLGAGIYFIVLLSMSRRLRSTVQENSPIRLPFVS